MNRLLWGIAFLVLGTVGGWAQSTWRGQAEVWAGPSAPAVGFVVASNDFPPDSLLTVENYKSHKTIQVRVVSALPPGSSALVVLNPNSAQALDIKAGDSPLVGVRLDPTGSDRPDNPDPDVNPQAAPAVATAPAPAPATGTPRNPDASTSPAPLPLPAVADTPAPNPTNPAPEASTPRAPLVVADEPEPTAPAAPDKTAFETSPAPAAVAVVPSAGANPGPEANPAPAVSPAPPAAVAVAPTPVAPPAPTPPATTPVTAPAEAPAPGTGASVPTVVPVKPAPGSAWVPVPAPLEGPVLGQVAVLPGLEKGRTYVQVGAWATEADLLKAMETVKTYVPLALYQAEGQKNPWRVVVASAPKAQLGVLLMLFRSEGFRTASVVKG